MRIKSTGNSGQALVLVLLSLAVVLTTVLFILARSVTDIAVSSRSEESVRAFSAAEAGVEKALVIGSGSGLTQVGTASYKSSVTNVASGEKSFNYPLNLAAGDTATIWFTAHDPAGNSTCSGTYPCFTGSKIKVCWGKEGTSSGVGATPAVEFSVFYETTPGDPATVQIARVAVDPNSARRGTFDAPDAGTCGLNGETFAFQKTVDFALLGIPLSSYNTQNGLQFARLRMFYNSDTNQRAAFDANFPGNSTLPSQGIQVDSSGSAGDSNRRLVVFQGWPQVPDIFNYAVYSGTGLAK